jgi:EAL domain-containing protein (putative c-di-GMP-specific phosphodiesterase class I)/GGDEF domain-containing protein
VTSARLDSSAKPRNRLFPKTRSWFALDAPLELLSPLSVVRVLFALAVVCWPLVGLTTTEPQFATVGIISATSLTFLTWLYLLRTKRLDPLGSGLLAGLWTVVVGCLVWCGHGTVLAGVYSAFLIPIVVFTALFFGNRAVMVQALGSLVVLAVALSPTQGAGRAIGFAVVMCLMLGLVSSAVLLLTRSARRLDSIDPDTGLPNGFGLTRLLSAEDSFVVAAVVLDGIGFAREALGYQIGTEILRRAVEDLGQVLPPGAVIGRVSGDELIVTLALDPEPSSEDLPAGLEMSKDDAGHADALGRVGVSLANTLVRAIAAGRYLVGSIDVPVTAHVGLSAAPWEGSQVPELVRRASLNARHAEAKGLSVAVSGDHANALSIGDLKMLSDLRLAPERGELTLAFQPQIESATRSAVSVEALMRWNGSRHGKVSPSRFIPLAERVGLMDGLTKWAVTEALDAQVRWRRAGFQIPVSVNLSAKSLPFPELGDWILTQLDARGLPSSCLTIEVTETAVADAVQAATMLAPLHQSGVRISIDDFGTGFTSLALLPTLPVDELKIDQCFVIRSLHSPPDEAIVRTIGELAHRLGLQAVAEGVESSEVADRMATLGIDLLQGFHFAEPMTEGDLLAYLRSTGKGRAPTMTVRSTNDLQSRLPG